MTFSTRLLKPAVIWPVLLAGLALIFVLVNARWIWLYRHAQPLDIDEAGYLSFAMIDYRALIAGGLRGWLQAIEAPSIQAPLTTALASMIFAIGGPHVVAAFVVPVLAGVVAIVASYYLACRLLAPGPALAAAALVASCPIVMNYARSFHFALPATAMTTLALLGLVRSERFSNVRWALLFGISLGLMPLARTMTIAFLPGLVVGAGIYALTGEGRRVRQLVILCCALCLAIVTASTWLAFNGTYVFHYLFSFGYGKQSSEYGSGGTSLGWNAWMETWRNLVGNIYLPHALVLLAGLVSAPVGVAVAVRRCGLTSGLRAALVSPVLPILLFIIAALAALTSSQNKGTAFVAPVVPALIVISVYVIAKTWHGRLGRVLGGTGLALVCLIATMPLLDLTWKTAGLWTMPVPGLGGAIVTDGRGPIQQYETFGGLARIPGTTQPVDRTDARAWLDLNEITADALRPRSNTKSLVAFGFRGFLYNINTVRLHILLAGSDPASLVQVDPLETGDTQAGYHSWLTRGDASAACLLLTLRDNLADIAPAVSKRLMEDAARQAGFRPLHDWPAPGGNVVTLWQRQALQPACPAG